MKNNYFFVNHSFSIETKGNLFHERAKDFLTSQKEEYSIVVPEHYDPEIYVLREVMKILKHENCILFHGCLIELNGDGYIFTAPGGTGKTTHMLLWKQVFGKRLRIINGDKPILQLTDEGVYAYGTPWNGKERYGLNDKILVKAIVYLKRGSKNSISKQTVQDAFPWLYEGALLGYSKTPIKYTMEMLEKIGNKVNLYSLNCTADIEAVKTVYKEINKKLQIQDLLDLYGEFIYTIVGVSMYPLLRQHKDVVTIKRHNGRLKKWDVPLYKKNGKFILHRILEVRDKDYVICGDNCCEKEYGITDNDILGVLTSIKRGNCTIEMTNKFYRLYVHLWCDFFPIRVLVLKIIAYLKKIRRKLGLRTRILRLINKK